MKLVTHNQKLLQARLCREAIIDPNDLFYIFCGQHLPWPNESSPPPQTEDIKNIEYKTYDNMIFGKRVFPNDVSLLIRKVFWTYNTVYARYDDEDKDLRVKDFYVVVYSMGAYHTFLCLDNNNNSPSLYTPSYEDTSPEEPFYFTADGYQWKYLFTTDATTFNKFSSNLYYPFVENHDVTGNSIPGAIESIIIEQSGNRYNSYSNGFFQEIAVNGNNYVLTIEPTSSSNTDFYRGSAIKIVQGPGSGEQRVIAEYVVSGGQKRVILDKPYTNSPTLSSRYEITPRVAIDGDGFDCFARAIVNPISNSISHIEISNTGYGYSYATGRVIGNTGMITSNVNFEEAKIRVILGPPKGFGGDVPETLFCDTLGVSVNFSNNELGTIPDESKFRTIGLIGSPLFNNVEVILTDIVGTFVDGETVAFNTTEATGEVTFYNEESTLLRLSKLNGSISTNTLVTGLTSNATGTITNYYISGYNKNFNTFDQRLRINITLNTPMEFLPNDKITQGQTFANAYVESANDIFVGVTNVRGTFNTSDINDDFSIFGTNGASANVNALIRPDLIKNSGDILYLENVSPVQRSANTSENIKLNITFD